ncbi:MAG: cytochrome C oxidase subunit IV family protein [Saprospiraceae bacterium]|nr:cytochrome C oxidase subunit IV family protein [Saprospiraceae bacterium]
MEHNDINHAKKVVFKGLILLGIITILEVLIALFGNGHLIEGVRLSKWIMYPLMIGLSLYKAYFIIYEFMHMKYELKGLRYSVLLPMFLLVWAVIAFFNEGNNWKHNRQVIQERNQIGLEEMHTPPPPAATHGEEGKPEGEH